MKNSQIMTITITITALFSMFFIGCSSTKSVISSPPQAYHPSIPTSDKELIREWQQSLIKIKEWQCWYDINLGSNYFYTNK